MEEAGEKHVLGPVEAREVSNLMKQETHLEQQVANWVALQGMEKAKMTEPLKEARLHAAVALRVVEKPQDLMALQPVRELENVAAYQERLVKGKMVVAPALEVASRGIQTKNAHLKVALKPLVAS